MSLAIVADSLLAVEIGPFGARGQRERGTLRIQLLENGQLMLTPWVDEQERLLELEDGPIITSGPELFAFLAPAIAELLDHRFRALVQAAREKGGSS